jgi:hypothetical protein
MKNKITSEADVIKTLATLLGKANAAAAAETGSCKYPVGIGGTFCSPGLTKAQCDEFEDSTWTKDGRCP